MKKKREKKEREACGLKRFKNQADDDFILSARAQTSETLRKTMWWQFLPFAY